MPVVSTSKLAITPDHPTSRNHLPRPLQIHSATGAGDRASRLPPNRLHRTSHASHREHLDRQNILRDRVRAADSVMEQEVRKRAADVPHTTIALPKRPRSSVGQSLPRGTRRKARQWTGMPRTAPCWIPNRHPHPSGRRRLCKNQDNFKPAHPC